MHLSSNEDMTLLCFAILFILLMMSPIGEFVFLPRLGYGIPQAIAFTG